MQWDVFQLLPFETLLRHSQENETGVIFNLYVKIIINLLVKMFKTKSKATENEKGYT